MRNPVAAARRVSGAFTAPVVDAAPDAERPWTATLYDSRLLDLDGRTGAQRWSTAEVADPGPAAQPTVPDPLLVQDTIVAQVGGIVFSVRPVRPARAVFAG
ncbi:hypothetical protein ABT075_11975 [Streptomyces sp. NPDC002677]|uniref:hypothetical protein n=1 Tax=Streptomyces sp. NPDC002677 TaxID=3154774 RepID=UPI00331CC548